MDKTTDNPNRRREYVIRLRALDTTPIQHVKAILKSLGRRHNMRCLSVYEVDHAEARGPAEPAASEARP